MKVIVGQVLLKQLPDITSVQKYSGVVVVTDKNVHRLWLKPVLSVLPASTKTVVVPAGEAAKNITHLQSIWTAMLEAGCDRKSLVITLGGGAVTDLGGFAAATYMRGVDVIHIPTTLLAQVDAAIGGKTGIDFGGGKNIIGVLHLPKVVIIDVDTLSTLPKRQLIAGFSEMIKHGLITDKNYFKLVTSKKPQEFSAPELVSIIKRSVEIKTDIVKKDAKEVGLRKILNFGHTVGHALEALSLETNTPLLHGEAVTWGILAEAQISQKLKLLSKAELKIIRQALQLIELPKLSVNKVMQKMNVDKKMDHGQLQWTLLKRIGQAVINQHVDKLAVKEVLHEHLST